MCLQCETNAVLVKENVLPGLSLYQAMKHADSWPAGHYGLVEMNDPILVFAGPILLDPCDGLDEDALDAMPEFPAGYDEYQALAEQLSKLTTTDPVVGYQFVKACMDAGYDSNRHGTKIGYWLAHHIATQLQ